MRNQFGETYTDELVESISQRVMSLNDKELDELWYMCGWIEAGKGRRRRAMTKTKAQTIRRNPQAARRHIGNLLQETPKDVVLANLDRYERKSAEHPRRRVGKSTH